MNSELNKKTIFETLTELRLKSGLNSNQIADITQHFRLRSRNVQGDLKYDISYRTVDRVFHEIDGEAYIRNNPHNLAYVLGVFYAIDVIELADLKSIFRQYDVATTFIDGDREKLWKLLEEGKKRYKSSNQSNLDQDLSPEDSQSKDKTENIFFADTSPKNLPLQDKSIPSIRPEQDLDTEQVPIIRDVNQLKNNKQKQAILYISIGIILLMATVGIIWISSQFNSSPDDTPTQLTPISNPTELTNDVISPVINCDVHTQAHEPIFLPDQGFSQFLASDIQEESVLNNEIRKVAINSEGVWVGYMAGNVDGVSVYNGTNWYHCLGLNTGVGNTNDFAFLDNATLVAIDRLGIARLDNTGWYIYDMVGVDTAVYQFFSDGSDTWISTYGGVAKLVGNNWQVVHQSDPRSLYNNRVFSYLIDRQGFEWFGLLSDGISRYSSASRQWDRQFINEIPLQNIRGIVERELDGSIWFASSGQGVGRYYNGQWALFDTNNSNLLSNLVEDIEVDKYGRIWIATPLGIAFTEDNGLTWKQHSSMSSIDIEFGCAGCPDTYNNSHIWIVLSEGNGIAHVRIPPESPTIRILSAPESIELMPGEPYVFSISVEVIGEQLSYADGDALYIADPFESDIFQTVAFFPMRKDETRSVGMEYVFHNTDNPLIAPEEPGLYTLHLRIWQGGRYVTDPILIQIEVRD